MDDPRFLQPVLGLYLLHIRPKVLADMLKVLDELGDQPGRTIIDGMEDGRYPVVYSFHNIISLAVGTWYSNLWEEKNLLHGALPPVPSHTKRKCFCAYAQSPLGSDYPSSCSLFGRITPFG